MTAERLGRRMSELNGLEAIDTVTPRSDDELRALGRVAAAPYFGPSEEELQQSFEIDKDWQNDGLCQQTDPDAFFPEKGDSTVAAKKICNVCEVRDSCLEYALKNDEQFGIWGGLSSQERRKITGRRRSSLV